MKVGPSVDLKVKFKENDTLMAITTSTNLMILFTLDDNWSHFLKNCKDQDTLFVTESSKSTKPANTVFIPNMEAPTIAQKTEIFGEVQVIEQEKKKLKTSVLYDSPIKNKLDGSKLQLQKNPIGRGSFGIVYEGMYEGKTVAVKFFSNYVEDNDTITEFTTLEYFVNV